jgi:hypothetical protein
MKEQNSKREQHQYNTPSGWLYVSSMNGAQLAAGLVALGFTAYRCGDRRRASIDN